MLRQSHIIPALCYTDKCRAMTVVARSLPLDKTQRTPAGASYELMASRYHRSNSIRKFYTCPLGQSDPQRCKYFKWADEISSTTTVEPSGGQALGGQTLHGASTSAINNIRQNAHTLGQSPQSRYGKPVTSISTHTTPTANRISNLPITPQTGVRDTRIERKDSDEGSDEIDWEKVDTDSLERDAIASTPGSSQRQSGPSGTPTLREKLAQVANNTPGGRRGESESLESVKRKREEDDVDKTPKRAVRDAEDVSSSLSFRVKMLTDS